MVGALADRESILAWPPEVTHVQKMSLPIVISEKALPPTKTDRGVKVQRVSRPQIQVAQLVPVPTRTGGSRLVLRSGLARLGSGCMTWWELRLTMTLLRVGTLQTGLAERRIPNEEGRFG
jgi:hypothetical protein